MMKHKQPPTILIGAIPFNSGDEIRVELTKYAGRSIISIWRWFVNDDGELQPTRKGIAISLENLSELNRLVSKAHKRAKREGLLGTKEGK